ncbi:hypothetical protein BBJ28_00013061 [Nothophytophthora sp. Chile5]|nr:hypothetical protein BBJ28_00013061 [Nothophytophthora sp. Chile5]
MVALQIEQLCFSAAGADFDGRNQVEAVLEVVARPDADRQSDDDSSTEDSTPVYTRHRSLMSAPGSNPRSDSVHQTGTRYSSNSAGDGPEKTRDRKSWFPRFKSNWLGTFRSKQMFHCCECAVVASASGGGGTSSSLSSQAGRYKGAEGKHCRCGKDQWHLAKSVEETEYNRRMEISKSLGGMRYDEAVLRLRNMGTTENDLKRMQPTDRAAIVGSPTHHLHHPRSSRGFPASSSSSSSSSSSGNPPKRARSVSSEPPSSSSLASPATRAYAAPQLMKPELSTITAASPQTYVGYDKSYGVYSPLYGGGGAGVGYSQTAQPQGPADYEHLVPPPFADEEGFGELLQGILEDDPRAGAGGGLGLSPSSGHGYAPGRYGYPVGPGSTPTNGSVAPLKRTMSMPTYAMTPTMLGPK